MPVSTGTTELEEHPEFEQIRPLIEGYVQQRILDFARRFAWRLNLGWSEEELLKVVRQTQSSDDDAVDSVPSASLQPQPALANLKLSLRHECQSTGCGEDDCTLCQYNPDRRCVRNFKSKYLVEDKLRAKCDAPIFVDILNECDERSPEPVNLQLHVVVLDHAKYDEMTRSGIEVTWEMLTSCIVTWSKGAKKVRVLHKPGLSDDEMSITFTCEKSSVSLSELSAMVSSEATLTGHRPQYCLLVSAVDENGMPLPHVSHAMSEPFTVATRRVKSSAKAEIPVVYEDVSKLVHMGKATVEKLLNLTEAAKAMSVDFPLPDHLQHITKVGEFKQLMELIEGDFNARKKLMAILKLPADKLEEACQHAASAVVPDSRPRIWISIEQQVGLVFRSRCGAIPLDTLEGVVPEPEEDGSYDISTMIPMVSITDDALLHAIQNLRIVASNAWRTPSHPGWHVVGTDEELHGRAAPVSAGSPNLGHTTHTKHLPLTSGCQQPGVALRPTNHYPPGTPLIDLRDPGSAASPTLTHGHDTMSNATSPHSDATKPDIHVSEHRGAIMPPPSYAESLNTTGWSGDLDRPPWTLDIQPPTSRGEPRVPPWEDAGSSVAAKESPEQAMQLPGFARAGSLMYLAGSPSPFESHLSQNQVFQTLVDESTQRTSSALLLPAEEPPPPRLSTSRFQQSHHPPAGLNLGPIPIPHSSWQSPHDSHRTPKRQNTGYPPMLQILPSKGAQGPFCQFSPEGSHWLSQKAAAPALYVATDGNASMPALGPPIALSYGHLPSHHKDRRLKRADAMGD